MLFRKALFVTAAAMGTGHTPHHAGAGYDYCLSLPGPNGCHPETPTGVNTRKGSRYA